MKFPLFPFPKTFPLGATLLTLWCLACLAGCGGGVPPIPPNAATARTTPDAAAIFNACLAAHGGRAAYARLHDVNVHFDSHWAAIGPRLQPILSDRNYRQGSQERYMPVKGGFIVGQEHTGPDGTKHVFRAPPEVVQVSYDRWGIAERVVICYNEADERPVVEAPHHEEVKAAAGLVTDAYAMFLWGPYFFVQRNATFQKVSATAEVDGQPCDELLTILHPGFGVTPEDKAVLYIGQRDHLLHRVQFTLNALESTRGAEVHVDLLAHERIAGVMWPGRFVERIERPVSLPAHRWSLLALDVNRGYSAADLNVRGFKGRAKAPAGETPH